MWTRVPVGVTASTSRVSVGVKSCWRVSSALRGVAVRCRMRLLPVLVTLSVTVGVAYYVYVPVPDAIQEPWKLMMLDAGFRAGMQLVRQEMFPLGLWCTRGSKCTSTRRFAAAAQRVA